MYKFSKNDQSRQNKALKPYSFPYMPAGTAVTEKKEVIVSPFRRIYFNDEEKDFDSKVRTEAEAFENIKAETKNLEAYREGFRKGEKDALELVREKLEPLLQSFRKSIDALEKAKKELSLRTEQEAVELALAIAKRILHREVSINKEVILNIARAALKKVVDRKKIKIRLAESDFQFLNENREQLPGIEEDFEKVTFEEDKSILTGGCVIETNLGDIDARIETQLKVVEKAFKSEINRVRGN